MPNAGTPVTLATKNSGRTSARKGGFDFFFCLPASEGVFFLYIFQFDLYGFRGLPSTIRAIASDGGRL